MHNQNIDYDIITDDELDREGVEVIRGYDALMTGTHPEYHTTAMLDALMAYRDGGGRLTILVAMVSTGELSDMPKIPSCLKYAGLRMDYVRGHQNQ